jgi:hypothetical protein
MLFHALKIILLLYLEIVNFNALPRTLLRKGSWTFCYKESKSQKKNSKYKEYSHKNVEPGREIKFQFLSKGNIWVTIWGKKRNVKAWE